MRSFTRVKTLRISGNEFSQTVFSYCVDTEMGVIQVFFPQQNMAKKIKEARFVDIPKMGYEGEYDTYLFRHILAVIRFNIVNASSSREGKALNVNYLWINEPLLKGKGLGSLLVYEAATLCAEHYSSVDRFEINGALESAFGFYLPLGLHVSPIGKGDGSRENPFSRPTVYPAPSVSESSLDAMQRQRLPGPEGFKPNKFNREELDLFNLGIANLRDYRTKLATELLETSLENILYTSETQVRKAGWLI